MLKIVVISLIFVSSFAQATSPVPAYETQKPDVALTLPSDAAGIISEYDTQFSELQKAHLNQVKELREATIKKLVPLQTKYTRDNKLDEAVAIRDKVRDLKGILQLSAWRPARPDDIGQKYTIELVGNLNGAVWGTDIYTADSNPAAAAVHAGILKVGQKGLVEIEILKGQASYPGTLRNEVNSQNYGPWGASYKIQKAD